jgi:hypothetical protein
MRMAIRVESIAVVAREPMSCLVVVILAQRYAQVWITAAVTLHCRTHGSDDRSYFAEVKT